MKAPRKQCRRKQMSARHETPRCHRRAGRRRCAWPLTGRAQGAAGAGISQQRTPARAKLSLKGVLAGLEGRRICRWPKPEDRISLGRRPGSTDCRRWLRSWCACRLTSIFAAQGNVTALAAKRATSTIPIVFATSDDPVATGLVASFNRPGGNLTGVSRLGTELGGKNLELLHALLPSVSDIGHAVRSEATRHRGANQECAGCGASPSARPSMS